MQRCLRRPQGHALILSNDAQFVHIRHLSVQRRCAGPHNAIYRSNAEHLYVTSQQLLLNATVPPLICDDSEHRYARRRVLRHGDMRRGGEECGVVIVVLQDDADHRSTLQHATQQN